MLKEEIIEQIELIEKDHKIKPDPKRRQVIADYMKKIHTLRTRIYNTTDSEQLQSRQANLFEAIQGLLDSMEHPQAIIDALSKQRFFTIKQHPSLYLDTVTGFLFPRKLNDFVYSNLSLAERNRVLKDFESSGLMDWEFPTNEELLKLFNTQIAQYSGISCSPSCSTLHNFNKIWVDGKDVDAVFDTNRLNKYATSSFGIAITMSSFQSNNRSTPNFINNAESALFFPINKLLKPKKYLCGADSNQISRLALFLYNARMKISFPSPANQKLYDLFYIDYLNLHLQLIGDLTATKSEETIATQSSVTVASFDSDEFKNTIDPSLSSYCTNVLSFLQAAESYLNTTDASLQKLHENIAISSTELLAQPNSSFLQNSLELLVDTLSIKVNHPLSFIEDAKQKVLTIQQHLEQAKSYADLLVVEQQPKVSYSLLIDFTEQHIHRYVDRVRYLGTNTEIIEKLTHWYKENIKAIQQRSSNQIRLTWQAAEIDADEYEQWIVEMEEVLQSKYELYLPILHDLLANKISFTSFEQLDTKLQVYIENIYQFYQKERVEAHQKFAFQLGGDLQEKLEVQTLLYKLVSPLITSIHDYMKDCPNAEQKCIASYLQYIIEVPINHLDHLVADYTFVQDILEDLHTLKQAQLQHFAVDTQHFIEQQQQRDARYNALMYKMRKQLMKQ